MSKQVVVIDVVELTPRLLRRIVRREHAQALQGCAELRLGAVERFEVFVAAGNEIAALSGLGIGHQRHRVLNRADHLMRVRYIQGALMRGARGVGPPTRS